MLREALGKVASLSAVVPSRALASNDVYPYAHRSPEQKSAARKSNGQRGMLARRPFVAIIGSPGRARIPRPAGLTAAGICYADVSQEPGDAPLLDGSFQLHCITSVAMFLEPDKLPRPLESLCGLRLAVGGVVVLADPSFQIIRLAAVIPAGAVTSEDVDPATHPGDAIAKKENGPEEQSPRADLSCWLPGQGSNLQPSG